MSREPVAPGGLFLPARVLAGPGRTAELGPLAARMGRKAFLVTGGSHLRESGALAAIEKGLRDAAVEVTVFGFPGEPEVSTVDEAAARARAAGCDVVVGAGGGSALDLAKAAAALLRNPGSVRDYLEGIGTGAKIEADPAAFVAVPTTSGTGTEASQNAVITSRKDGVKRSVRDGRLVARAVILDPELTASCPPDVTAAAGMDALTQLVEPLTGRRATALTNALAITGIQAVGWALPRTAREGRDLEARGAMAHASFLSGVCLAHAGLGLVHALAPPLGGLFSIPHSVVCARLLPLAARANLAAIHAGRGAGNAIRAYEQVDLALGRSLREFCADFPVPGFSSFGMTEGDIPRVVAGASGSSMRNNAAELPPEEIAAVLRAAL